MCVSSYLASLAVAFSGKAVGGSRAMRRRGLPTTDVAIRRTMPDMVALCREAIIILAVDGWLLD